MTLRTRLAAIAAVCVAAACGDGILRLAEITGSGFTSGSAQEFGSIVINDVRYDTDSAEFVINGLAGSQDDLVVGQRLLLQGVDNGDGTGTAELVQFTADLIAAVDSVDAAASRFTALGQTVHIDGVTVFDGGSFATLTAGSFVSASGSFDADGSLRAEAVQVLASAPALAQVRGRIRGLNTASQSFRLAGLQVDYASSSLVQTGALANDVFVTVRGDETGAGLQADSVRLAAAGTGAAGDVVRLRGLIERRADNGGFVTAGRVIRLVAGSSLIGGNAEELNAGTDVSIIGLLAEDGTVQAASVEVINPQERSLPVSIVATVEAVSDTRLQVLGLDIRPRSRTLVRDARDDQRPFGLTDLQVGDTVALRCFGDNGTIVVNRVERVAPATGVAVTAPLLGTDETAQRINVDGVITDTTAATFEDAAGEPLTSSAFYAAASAGDFVDVEGSFDGALLTATRIVLND